MILAVANTKGGVGKTTIAFLLALARARAGREVWLVDADPQGSASTAATVRADAGACLFGICRCAGARYPGQAAGGEV